MHEPHAAPADPRRVGPYEIRVQGRIAPRWTAWFDGSSFTHRRDGTTVIRTAAIDQAALHGLLQRVRDLNLVLIELRQVAPAQGNASDSTTDVEHDRRDRRSTTA